MKRWQRRLLYLVVTLVWLVMVTLPFFGIFLAARGEVQLGASSQRHLRLFLVQEQEAEGLGLEWARPLASNPDCQVTDIRYFLWEGSGQNVRYCTCVPGSFAGTAANGCPDG